MELVPAIIERQGEWKVEFDFDGNDEVFRSDDRLAKDDLAHRGCASELQRRANARGTNLKLFIVRNAVDTALQESLSLDGVRYMAAHSVGVIVDQKASASCAFHVAD
jgi:hypothetical protein